MFWGLIMEPNKRYTQVVEKPFHISQAAMDISTGDNGACQVMVVADGKNFLVCTLQKSGTIQVPLDLYFKSGDSVAFLTNGKCNVHLTGYLDPEFEDDLEEEEEEDEDEEEAPELVLAKNKRKPDKDVAAVKAKKSKKATAAADSSSDEEDDDDDGQLHKLLDGEDLDSDENDDSFKANLSGEADSDDSDEEEEAEEEEDDSEEDDEDNDTSKDMSKDTTLDTSLDTSKAVDMSKLSKAARRRLKKKLAKKGQTPPQMNGHDKPKEKQDGQQKKSEKGKKKSPSVKEAQQNGADEPKREKKSLAGGVFIEDLKVGEGPVAKPGKTVQVYYEGRLKNNNKMFDNCLKGPGFKFRLGGKEVISGWDTGVAGMKVGGKRKIVCPPAMAYGAKGAPPTIPPNSTLVFEVELKNVK